MTFVRRALLGLSLVAFVNCGVARADWSMSNLFSSNKKSSSKLSNKRSVKAPSSTQKVVNTLTSGPKKIYSNTKSMLTPTKTANNAPRSAGWNTAPKPAKSTGVSSWFKPEPKPMPRTVKEWMAQPRVLP